MSVHVFPFMSLILGLTIKGMKLKSDHANKSGFKCCFSENYFFNFHHTMLVRLLTHLFYQKLSLGPRFTVPVIYTILV